MTTDNLSPTEEEVAELFTKSLTEDTNTDETAETANTDETTDQNTQNDLEDTAEDETVEDTDADSDTDADDSDDDADSENDTADADDDLITYELNGKEYKWTQEEFLEAHQNGLRQADYSKKTMELAEERKAWEASKEQAIQERQAELDKLLDRAKDIASTERKSPEELAKLAKDDPYSYNALKAQYDAEDQLIAYKTQQEQAKFQEIAQAETQKLTELVPAFKEDFDGTYKQTIDYMVENGVDENTAKSLVNAPLMKMVYDSMTANKGISKNKVKIVQKSVANKKAPELNANKKRAAAIQNAKSVDDLGDLISLELG